MSTILLTGIAGFIGSAVAKELIHKGHTVIGLDNFNSYYDVSLKRDRITQVVPSSAKIIEGDILDKQLLETIANTYTFDCIVHLAAQAGVRYSLEQPDTYIQTNIQGTHNIFELARQFKIKKVVYASSSSVYGANTEFPFSETQCVERPISLYAMSKKANELEAYTYNHLFGTTTIGLRFFTVYGPWSRPDMALHLFAKSISENTPIKLFNNGNMERNFTYIADIVQGVVASVERNLEGNHIFNLGNNKTATLLEFVTAIEHAFNTKAEKILLPMQQGDVLKTEADISLAEKLLAYTPTTNIQEGIQQFVNWFKEYQQNK